MAKLSCMFNAMKKLMAIITLLIMASSCYEYKKLPNTKRVTKRAVRKAMKYSTWEYPHYEPKQTTQH